MAWFVSTLVTTTFAPWTMAPLGSRTLTTSPPASCWANRVKAPSADKRHSRRRAIPRPLNERARTDMALDSLFWGARTLVLGDFDPLSIVFAPVYLSCYSI